ncbi:MAG TPA: cytochrome c3 family protein [Candidatus Dormibacteraeota bacterium]|nr:cytochrome c3 family protein [Candidatus Dormibacteraeota bacterium]
MGGRASRIGGGWWGLFAGLCATLSLLVWAGGAAADNDDCMKCHGDRSLVRKGDYRPGSSVFVDTRALSASMHEGMDCVDCHAAATDDHPPRLAAAACAACHEDEQAQYAGSLHGLALAKGTADAPTCANCHGGHDILAAADPASLVNRQKIPGTCAGCHADVAFNERRPVRINRPLEGYQHSVHFQSLMADGTGATCTDCHAAHELSPSADPRSSISHGRIVATCGRCHEQIAAVFAASIHGRAVAHGNADAPTCIDCHGEHDIRGPQDPESSVYPSRVAQASCVGCHESERISRRYGMVAGRLSTYLDSYHGLASRGGSTTVANCASCHGVHDIRPSSDPLSSVNRANLPQTCGKCHPGAGENFAIGTIHAAPGVDNGEHPVVHFVRRFYLWLIVVIVGAMVLHNGFDFARRFGRPRLPYGRDVLRFTVNERLQHGLLVLSFVVLAYSGFALKFPDAWWAVPFNWLGAGEPSRRLVHRGAALVMVGIGLYHLGWLGLSRRGRSQWQAIRPRWQDVRDVGQMVRFYLGRASRGAAFARFSYAEKVEYWALLWGSVVMTLTGLALWFNTLTLQMVPKWALDLATVVHYYEAWLATLAIVVWHFYWVIFNPQVYPMSLVWLHGYLSREAMAHDHPRELEERERDPEP